MTTNELAASGVATTPSPQSHPPIIHLGKVKAKHAKKLKKGKGDKMLKVTQAYEQLKGEANGNFVPVLISYEEKPKKKRKKNKLNFMGIKIDRKKLKKQMRKSGIRSSFL
ncbi:MAG: hypothetical protein ACKVTZ_17400 [Bacteroidia bacterium]